jgi:Niemann-Pick C1 protein
MYDVCGHRADGDALDCANNTRAVAPSGELALVLQATCPTLWSEQGGMNGSYCCSARQVEILQNSVSGAVELVDRGWCRRHLGWREQS